MVSSDLAHRGISVLEEKVRDSSDCYSNFKINSRVLDLHLIIFAYLIQFAILVSNKKKIYHRIRTIHTMTNV